MERKKRKCFGLLLALFIMFGLSLSVFSEDSSAVSDLVYTFDISNIPSWYDICSLSSDCSSYSFMSVEPSNPGSCSNASSFMVNGIIGANVPVSSCTSSLFFLSSPSNIYLTGGKSGDYSGSITITLSETSDFISSCPEIEPCPVIPEYPYEDDLASIKNAILLCGGAILVIYFFYAIYKMILGGL